ncbi:NAD(P)/FAD-dependent oxidoreductase [Mesorhizobium sp. YC-39]|uniref:phytoene desaturase family protein n=1 Tax=unclassified Mesorhizobium TaxID=325217 RepID=UPI0021E82AC2|nr:MULTISPECIES: NAD(P)/FAD-dependent oxidoreductase [unclassified Mesorhizobium]MCV3210824.1 NAD(P)/FAD-dependent oxidoreductase [Mesorhizobium sp. YC-2]MCV3231058.1 NAD(P)/FAD-dependent oxidoreductase [Mesorhizobium sp. YC-39]
MSTQYDAIIVGGGHNGLVCGAYLAKAGVKACVLERRPLTGGAAVTEEIWPGYRVSTASYYMGLLQPKVILDLELKKHGFEVVVPVPTVFPLEDGRFFTMWDDPEEFRREIARFSEKDAAAYPAYRAHLLKIAPFMKQLIFETPVDPGSGRFANLRNLAAFAWRFRKIGSVFYDIYNLLTLSAYDYLGRWFESDEVKLVLGFFAGGGGANSSIRTPASAYMLVRSIVRDQTTAAGPSGFMKGGMGMISDSIRRSGESHGLAVRTDAEVAEIITENGKAMGVRLASGEVIGSRIVIGNASAKTTFLKLVDPARLPESFVRDIRSMRTESTVFRISLALDGLPQCPSFAAAGIGFDFPAQFNIAKSVRYMEDAYHQSRNGEMSSSPFLILKFPTVSDPSIAPPGHHILSIFGGHAPYTLKEGHWDERRDELHANVMRVLTEYFPDIEKHIVHSQILTPLDLERIFDLPNGHVHHGEISADQMFFRRPAAHYADYRSPIEGLYQCGASTHPGGGVTGMPGHNAARVILADRKRWQ